MPFDFDAIVNAFRIPLLRELNPIKDMLERLGDWLEARVRQTNALEVASRDFPVVRFYQEAVTAWVDTSQHGVLGPRAPARAIGETLSASGRALVRGLGVAEQSVREALILPRLLGMVGSILDVILESIERFLQPSPALFDPGARRASDLFGQAGLFFRAFGTSLGQVREFVRGAQALRAGLQTPADPLERLGESARSASGGAEAAEQSGSADLLDEVGRYITGAILALPLLPALLGNVLGSAGLVLRVKVLDLSQKIESLVLRLRRRVIEFVYIGMMDHVRQAVSLAAALGGLLMDHLRYYARFALGLGNTLLTHLSTYLRELSAYLQYWTRLAERIRRTLEAFLDFDLMPILLLLLGLPGPLLSSLPGAPRFTIGDLFDVGVGVAITTGRIALNIWLTGVEAAVLAAAAVSYASPFIPNWSPWPVLRRIEALRRILNLVVRIPRRVPAETRLPSLAGVTFPNIFNAFFGPGVPNLGRALAGTRDRLVADIPGMFGAARAFLNDMSDIFQVAAGRASRLGSLERYQFLAESAGNLAEGIFGGQAGELRERMMGSESDALAQAFESWVVNGGFTLVGQAIPAYVAEMAQYWQEQAREETPTSPHLLRRRRRLGRVQVPRLTIRASGWALDEELADTVASRFLGAIQDAYRTGTAQYARHGAS